MERLPAGRLPLVQPCHVTHPGYAHHRRPGPVISGLIRKMTDGLIIWSLKTFTANSSRATRQKRASAYGCVAQSRDDSRFRGVTAGAVVPGRRVPICVRLTLMLRSVTDETGASPEFRRFRQHARPRADVTRVLLRIAPGSGAGCGAGPARWRSPTRRAPGRSGRGRLSGAAARWTARRR
jgi:hypothetical protein